MAKKEITGSAVAELVEKISNLTVLDLSELVTALQDKLGVSPMTVATPSASSGQAAPAEAGAVESSGNQTVVLTAVGDNKIAVIKALREINQALGLQEAKTATENVPFEVLKDAKPEDVKSATEKLKAAGATIELK